MRFTTSQHLESLRTRFSYYWPQVPHDHSLRPSLNITYLIELLKEARNNNDASESPSPSGQHGKKRAFSRSPASSERQAKRLKPSPSNANQSDIVDDPKLLVSSSQTDIVSVYHHLTEIQYTLSRLTPNQHNHTHDDDPGYLQWFEDEKALIELLDEMFSDITAPKMVDLGDVTLQEYLGRLVALPSTADFGVQTAHKWLLLVPRFNQEIDTEAHDFLSPNMEDILIACHRLMTCGRAKIDAHLKLIGLPFGAYDKSNNELPFRLQTDITISLIIPSIAMPIPYHANRKMASVEDAQRRFLDFVFPADSSIPASFTGEINIPFFYSILRPAPRLQSGVAEGNMQPNSLLPTLLPFQKRGVGWMLEREGKFVTPEGNIAPIKTGSSLPPFWDRIDERSNTWYINRLSGVFSLEPPCGNYAFGGILADEQGLGKTLECIALILLNPAPGRNPTIKRWDPEAGLAVKQIKTTLIVTPVSLLSQWVDELKAHAPTLKVLVYDGWAKLRSERKAILKVTSKKSVASKSNRTAGRARKRRAKSDDDMDVDTDFMDEDGPPDVLKCGDEGLVWEEYVNTFDVCLTTYNVLRQDLTVARAVPIRPRREDVVYSNVPKPRSPLVVCEWYRVIMDEVQMVGGGKVEDMVSLIPRLSSFAVSGTPARLQVYDLIHVLNFLRVNNNIGPLRFWKRLLKPGFADLFASFFGQYAIRTMKAAVKDELTIPQQTRFLVSIDLGRVERHVYDQNLEAALLDLGLDARGVAASDGWQVDTSLLRSLIRKLRGICTHPQVGQLQKKDKSYKPGTLKSMSDVLEAMRDQNWRNLMDDQKLKVQALIRCAQLHQHHKTDENCCQHALETLLLAEKESNQMINSVKAAIADHEAKCDTLKTEAAALKESRRQTLTSEPEEPYPNNGKGKARERAMSTPSADIDDLEDDLPNTPAGEDHAVKRRALQQRLRECYVCLHRVKFLQGDAYHILGASHSPSEDAAYAAAEGMRRDLLKTTEQNAKHAMAQLSRQAAAKGITKDALLIEVPYCGQGGIRSSDLMDEANDIIEDIINEQSMLLWEWRSCVEKLLTQNLSPGEDEADGQEYARSLDTQGEAETYLQAYAALLADRREVLVAERTLLAAHDVREKKLRHTKAAIKAAAAAELEIPDDIELQPEHEVLHKDLSTARKDLLQRSQGRALKSVMVDLNAIAARIQNDKDPEKIIAKDGAQQLRQLISAQGTLMDKLEADLARFRKAFNERILYFRQLQEISDSVAEVTWETGLGVAIQAAKDEQNDLEAKINTSRARHRYLDHLSKNKEEGTLDEDDESCILCRCDFTRGFITQCAHIFCEGCLKAWLLRKEGKACPVCRVIINVDQMQRFTVQEKQADPLPPAKPINDEPAPRSRREIHYNMIDPTLFKEIQTMDSIGSYGRKIQGLVQHLLYLQITDPGAKSIVFSAWADSLHIIEHALMTNNIPCLRIDQRSKGQGAAKKFRTSPDILVLLLHGERENAGLNITCASRVFLVESVVHHGFEVQAIARIDRMGQTRPTEVYCYYAEDTVERNILDLAVKQGLSLYTKENSIGSLNVSSLAIDANKKASGKKKVQKGDFIFDTDDMLAILFPHLFEDIEYLLPSEEGAVAGESPLLDDGNFEPAGTSTRGGYNANAIAGPSRLS